ncbi:MAG: contractile injection system tape measure protein [Marinifilaceae bacterium]|jgi:hypothetical protein
MSRNSSTKEKAEARNSTLIGSGKESFVQEVYCVKNAGLVLLSPFFCRLFHELGLMENESFGDFKAKEWAVLLLQYLVSERTHFKEEDLKLNKILVGLNDPRPIATKMIVNRKEQEVIHTLLRNIIGQWKGLSGTTAEEFREIFLRREGILVRRKNNWYLTVKPKPYDSLLKSLPWQYSLVFHPWMFYKIFVTWKL